MVQTDSALSLLSGVHRRDVRTLLRGPGAVDTISSGPARAPAGALERTAPAGEPSGTDHEPPRTVPDEQPRTGPDAPRPALGTCLVEFGHTQAQQFVQHRPRPHVAADRLDQRIEAGGRLTSRQCPRLIVGAEGARIAQPACNHLARETQGGTRRLGNRARLLIGNRARRLMVGARWLVGGRCPLEGTSRRTRERGQ